MHLIQLIEQEVKWIKPDDGEDHDEVIFQLQADQEEAFLDDWVKDALSQMVDYKMYRLINRRNGDIQHISPSEQLHIGNTGASWDESHWKPESKERVPKMFQSGQQITMPIIIANTENNEKWLLGGHHRLTYNSQQLHQSTPCWVISYPFS